MNKTLGIFAVVASAAIFTGCASGPKYADMKASIPALAQGSGRIYFYRTVVAGAAVQPEVRLNNEVVGTAKPKGFFYVDRAPGNYTVETRTEVTRQLSLALE